MEIRWSGIPRRMSFAGYEFGPACSPPPAVINRGCMTCAMPPPYIALISWYRQGADVQRLLPQLATYLGHVHIAATQRYLTMTPELLHEASQRFERYAG